MSRWYEDAEERADRIASDNEDAARDRYEEKRDAQLVAEHDDGEHRHAKCRDCPLCEVQVDDA